MTERTPKPGRKRYDPWPEAAQQLARLAAQQLGSADQLQQQQDVCAKIIMGLCESHPSPAAVKSHKLLQLLGTVLSTLLDHGNHRKWRQTPYYAARVSCLIQSMQMVMCMAGAEVDRAVTSAVATLVSSQLSESGLLPKLAVAVQEVAVVLAVTAAQDKAVDAATAVSSQPVDQQSAWALLPVAMLALLVQVLKVWPGGVLGSAAAAPLALPAAQLAAAAISTHQQRWEAIGGQLQQEMNLQQQEMRACVVLSHWLMRLLQKADHDEQPQSLQLLRAPQYHLLLLLLLAVRAQLLPQPAADSSTSSASAGTTSSLPVAVFAGNASTSGSSSSTGTSSSSSSGQQTMQQQLANSSTAAGQQQQLPYQLQLWQALGLPQQLLGVACEELRPSEPEGSLATCFVLSNCLSRVVGNIRFASYKLPPGQMAAARLHQSVPMLLLETAAAFISNTSLVITCANAAAHSVNCWKLVLDEQLAKETDVKGQSGAAGQGASTAAAQLPVQALQQLVLHLFEQLMQQPEAARKLEPQQQQDVTTASSSSQRRPRGVAELQQQPGGSTEVTHALTGLVQVLQSLLHLPVEFHLSWQGFSAVLQTLVRNLLSCRSSKDVEPTKQEAAFQAAIEFSWVLDSLCIQRGSQEPGQLVRAAAAAAVGGAEQLQLFGLLLSTLKLWHLHILSDIRGRGGEVLPTAESVPYIHNIGLAAHHMLAALAPTATVAGAAAAGSSAAGFGEVQPAALPWLVLQARCLHLAGAVLRKQAAWKPTGGPLDDSGYSIYNNYGYAAQYVIPGTYACVGGAAEVASRLATYLRSCCCPAAATESSSSEQAGNAGTCTSAAAPNSDSRQQADVPAAQAGVLTAPSAFTSAALTAAAAAGPGTGGCDSLAAVQQELLSLAEALLPAVASAETAVMGLKALTLTLPLTPETLHTFVLQPGAKILNLLQQLQQGPGKLEELSGQLTAFGAALCTQLPTPYCCNNPGCTSMAMASEQQLVGGKSCICAGCQVARYCGKACQTAHWQQHRPVCRRIRKAAAVAGSST